MTPDFPPTDREPPPLPGSPPSPDREPPPIPGERLWPPAESPILPPEPPARRFRFPAWSAAAALVLLALYLGPLRSEILFADDTGRIPTPFDLTLRSGSTEKKIRIEKGSLHLLRGRWDEIEVTDPFYESTIHPLKGGSMRFTIQRNLRLRLKQASTGHPSVPQRGDPDPRAD
jgi:hypothetical protein